MGAAGSGRRPWASPDRPEQLKRHVVEMQKHRRRYPERAKARGKVSYALLTGRLVRPAACENCGADKKRLSAHHWRGYEHPLSVIFLCWTCHVAADKAAGAWANNGAHLHNVRKARESAA